MPVNAMYIRYRLQVMITLILILLVGRRVHSFCAPDFFIFTHLYRIHVHYSVHRYYGGSFDAFDRLWKIDLSFPSIMAVGGFVFSWSLIHTGSAIAAMAFALAAGAFAGAINGAVVVYIGVPSIIATIETQFFWRGTTALLSQGLALNLSFFRETAFHTILTGRLPGSIPVQFLWVIGCAVVVWAVLNNYPFGDNLRFTGDNPRAAKAMGIPVARTRMVLFSLMGTASAFTGVLVCSEMANWWPTQGKGYMLPVFASVFIGGTFVFGGSGTIYGTCIGAVIIGIVEAGIISAGLSGFWTRTVYCLIVIFAVSIYALIQKNKSRFVRDQQKS